VGFTGAFGSPVFETFHFGSAKPGGCDAALPRWRPLSVTQIRRCCRAGKLRAAGLYEGTRFLGSLSPSLEVACCASWEIDYLKYDECTAPLRIRGDARCVAHCGSSHSSASIRATGMNLQVWAKKLSGVNTVAVVLFNRGTSSASITVPWSAIGIPAAAAAVRDLWAHTALGSFDGCYAASVPGHENPKT
jgi:hypothetical protein